MATRSPIASPSTSGPIEEACEDDEEIRDCVAETVIHEFGHYFGLDEERDRGDRGEDTGAASRLDDRVSTGAAMRATE